MRVCTSMQALEDDEMMRQYAALLHRQDTAREAALLALQARTALRAEVAGAEVSAVTACHNISHQAHLTRPVGMTALRPPVPAAATAAADLLLSCKGQLWQPLPEHLCQGGAICRWRDALVWSVLACSVYVH